MQIIINANKEVLESTPETPKQPASHLAECGGEEEERYGEGGLTSNQNQGGGITVQRVWRVCGGV